jgi:hypothetical protein
MDRHNGFSAIGKPAQLGAWEIEQVVGQAW